MFDRWYAGPLIEKLRRPYVHIMFGARQTGKSTLLNSLLPPDAARIDLSNPEERNRFMSHPGEFIALCRAVSPDNKGQIVFVDEAQAVPAIFDAVQHLYDSDKERWRFVLCGSSARRLRRTGGNLLPGRSFLHHLYPLILPEQPPPEIQQSGRASFAPLIPDESAPIRNPLFITVILNVGGQNHRILRDIKLQRILMKNLGE